jgi:histidyl-tRNA synthetase
MKPKFTRPEGTFDIHGENAETRRRIEDKIREICARYGVSEERGVGETTDIVMKEMYTFTRGNETFALRPEGTANAARAYLQTGAYADAQPVKWFYIGPLFRAERPQKGRYRQYFTFGVEYFGTYSPYADAELIAIFDDILKTFGVRDVALKLNSLGGAECRAKYKEILKSFIDANRGGLCAVCLERYERNPLRVLDCKNEKCVAVMAGAPASHECLSKECREHFESVLKTLDITGVEYEIDKKTVRGLDYYTRTVFEFICGDLGAQDAVGGGGRYDKLIGEVGGPETGAVGFGMGFDRLMIILEEQGLLPVAKNKPKIYIGSAGEAGLEKAAEIAQVLRKKGVWAEIDIVGRSVKAQMKYADKIGAEYVAVIGGDEVSKGEVKLKKMSDGSEQVIKINELAEGII